MKRSYPSAGSYKNTCNVGFYFPKMCSHVYHRGSHQSGHGGLYKIHGRPHSSFQERSRMSIHGGPHIAHKLGAHMFQHGALHTFQYSGDHKPLRVHGVKGGKAVPLSHGHTIHSHNSHFKTRGVSGGWKHNDWFIINETEVIQILNERLSSYLGVIPSLEQENAQLEKKISKWYKNNAPSMPPDQSEYIRTIQELQNQISAVITEKAGIVLQINNSRLAVVNFDNKYETKLSLRSSIEADVIGLHIILEGINDETGKLESEIENLQQELLKMRRDSEQAINSLTSQLGTRVSVEVEAAPSADLNRALSELREQYENLIEINQQEAECLFTQMSKELNREVVSGSEQLQNLQAELINPKHSMQTMEIELQREQNMTSALEDNLTETKAYYASELVQLQNLINTVEGQRGQIRSELESHNQGYRLLMDQNTHLGLEIATYQRLLDGHGINMIEHPLSSDHIEPNHSVEEKVEEHPES